MTSTFPRRRIATAAFAALTSILAACGGGGGDDPIAPASSSNAPVAAGTAITRLFVAGDSLADVGTYGLKATVQRAADRAVGYPVYPEIVAAGLGLGDLCNHFSSTDGRTFTSNSACTNFAVGGASVINPVPRGGSRVPLSLEDQLQTALAISGGAWRAGDLIVVDAGANDAAGVADTYLDARTGGDAERAIYLALLGQQLSAGDIAQALAQPDGESVVAALYLRRLAEAYWNTVRASTLDQGATRVALLNVPDITLTPRFRNVVADLAAAEGAAAGAAYQSALRQWIAGFNSELSRLAAGESRVVVVPYFEEFTAQIGNPAAFGLTNVTDPSCPPGDFPDCTDAALDASPPAGLAPGWWKTWYYSDGFHPSPRGHELLAATVAGALARAGWR